MVDESTSQKLTILKFNNKSIGIDFFSKCTPEEWEKRNSSCAGIGDYRASSKISWKHSFPTP
jgi:hypothetical protein